MKSFAERIVNNAYKHNQIIIKEIRLKSGRKKKFFCFRDGTFLKLKYENSIVYNGKRKIKLQKNSFLRLKPESKEIEFHNLEFKPENRVAFYVRNYGYIKGIFRIGRILPTFFLDKFRGSHKYFGMEFCEGITFKVIRCDSVLHLECQDYGGIYDFYLNTYGKRYPPQMPENYYATAYFAANCAKLSTMKSKYSEAGKIAHKCANKYFIQYPFARIVFEHCEFKFGPLFESGTLLNLKKPHYREGSYSPVNVFALRVYNLALIGNIQQIRKYLTKIKKNMRDGLIQDNFRPMYCDANDITYHQFAAACLARAAEVLQGQQKSKINYQINKVIKEAGEFSYSLLLNDGQVSYYGRGMNNIYHIASATYLFAYLYSILKEKKWSEASSRCFAYLKSKGSNWLPTCLGDKHRELIGWQHCEMPYNMQSAYFLLNAAKHSSKASRRKHSNVYHRRAGWVRVAKGKYDIVITNGGEQLSWGRGIHNTGLPGIASLQIDGKAELLGLDSLFGVQPITDVPFGKKFPVSRWKLELSEHQKKVTIRLSTRNKFGKFSQEYKLSNDQIHIKSEAILKRKTYLQLSSLPTRKSSKLSLPGAKIIKVNINPMGEGRLQTILVNKKGEYSKNYALL